MKKFVIKSCLFTASFVVFFIVVNVIYMWLITSTDFNFIKRDESLNFHDPDFELIVLGASLPQDGIDAELLTLNGIKSYNLAIDGSSIRTNYIQLNEYLTEYSIKPQIVLLGVNSYLDSFGDAGIHPIVEFTMKDHRYSVSDVPILKFKWLGFEFLKKMVSSKHRNARLSYGQLKFQKINSDNTNFYGHKLDINRFESSDWMGELAQLCNQNGIELLVLEMPGYMETRNLSEIGPYNLFFKNGHYAHLYNFNSRNFCEIFDANKDWIGNSHLNEFGAIKFTHELIVTLNRYFSREHIDSSLTNAFCKK